MPIEVDIEPSWKKILSEEFEKPYFKDLRLFLIDEIKKGKIIYPHPNNIFSAFWKTPFPKVKVVILGQDPYHGQNQAHGLAFSVPPEQTKIPPSLQNIYKEIDQNTLPSNGNLTHWADQGVLLLNATLTVEDGKAGSHQKKGWEEFTDQVIRHISEEKKGVVFLLWGAYAQKKAVLVDSTKHHILTAPHPSPLSAYRGFFGCEHFTKTNTILLKQNQKTIQWKVPQ